MKAPRRPAVLLLGAVLLAGCSGGGGGDGDRPELVVLAAASLTDVMTELAAEFERQEGVDVVLSLGGSSTLAQQVVSGAPADLFVAASDETMQVVTRAGRNLGAPVVLARNRLQIAVPPGNPGNVRGLRDLARDELDIALCARPVPCGAAAERVLAAAGVTAAPDTLEQDVKAVLSKVRLREVDAGLVYVTDVRAAGDDVEGVEVPEAGAAANPYPAVVLEGSDDPDLAKRFLALLTSAEGRRVLARAGFAPP